ncbi:TatD family hydrolase [Lutibaculum baratangense]|uniref:Putative deoxyribonuclease YcfH n=1 Tax=Lutibaculum baratangense AMV1 TaxID=631454 RepID=V4RAR6_9HYPH|nr:TatD family hydrolase [Lutibaculum baratangense]ESR22484.1 putative deoxyribonuclease YcfH [Lutibaculum baratangense AMV1]
MTLVDSHCHLDFPDFAAELDDVVQRARDAGVTRLVTISTRLKRFDEIRAIAERYDDVYCSAGTHPHNASEEVELLPEAYVAAAAHPKCVAIGEAGLDFFYDNAPRADQEAGFRTQIEAARRTGLPLVIHSRDAEDDTARILREEMAAGRFDAILHCFSSKRELAEAGVELGLYVSFSGILTFKRSEELRAIAADIPADRLLVETDAPYLAPMPHRGKRNEPAFVVETARVLAETRGVAPEEIHRVTSENFFRLFPAVSRPE